MKLLVKLLGVLVVLTVPSLASNISFTGTFTYDTDVQYFTFTLLAPTPGVALRTWSYVGGNNAAGSVISGGGFEPLLNIWLSDGTQMNVGMSGPCTGNTGDPLTTIAPDPITGGCGDVYYPTTLAFPGGTWDPGTYTVGLSMYSNSAVGFLSDGYLIPLQGFPVPSNYTCMAGAPGVQGSPPVVPETNPFCDEYLPGVERTGSWALDILNVDSATQVGGTGVPEPATWALGLAGAAALLARTRQRCRTR